MAAGAVVVGRPKKQKSSPEPEPLKPRTVGVRCTNEWAAWLERGAKHCRTDVAKLIDSSVVDYLKARGFLEPPPERIP